MGMGWCGDLDFPKVEGAWEENVIPKLVYSPHLTFCAKWMQDIQPSK